MGKKIRDIDGNRWIKFDARNALIPSSVFMMGSNGLTMEFDLSMLVDALREEFGFLEPVAQGAEHFLMTLGADTSIM